MRDEVEEKGQLGVPGPFGFLFGVLMDLGEERENFKAPSTTIYLYDSGSQMLTHDSFYAHPDYPVDSYLS